MSDIVTYEVRGRVAVITLNRPDARNAVNGDVASGMEAAIDRLEGDSEVWVGVITASTEGQERPVFVYRLIASGTVEERVSALQERKKDLIKGVVEGAPSAMQLTASELRQLLSPLER